MEGETSGNGNFFMSLPEKMTYSKSVDRCNGLGLNELFRIVAFLKAALLRHFIRNNF